MENVIRLRVEVLKAWADITRLEILEFLKDGEKTANEVQLALEKSQSTISQHLKNLTLANLIAVRRDGTKKFYCIKDMKIFDILSLIDSFISDLNREKIDQISSMNIDDILR